ncbi:hypothetical protein DAI22_03g337100 [Oryza sativa Japonica Group]|uniref:Embryonic cell protein n=1 Tax=Oryza sativa subsp. japonica TaxID=39947 RepID=Q94GQ5_ORYSJ|nr:putative embryonic cell protein [Oryza sativa Japonica Group]KAF2941300.1 hypothetical protein DAI22_03g337100 [Oryza sativa Japonica Group]
MSQGQPRRPPPDGSGARPVMYGDVFDVSGELAGQPVAPRDAAKLQSAEEAVLGEAQKGGPAAAMQSAAAINARAGHVGRAQVTGAIADEGVAVAVAETELPGRRVVTESVAGQVVARLATPPRVVATQPSGSLDKDAVTIGRALEWRPRPPRRRVSRWTRATRRQSRPPRCSPRGAPSPSPEASPPRRRLRRTTTPRPRHATRTGSSSGTSSRGRGASCRRTRRRRGRTRRGCRRPRCGTGRTWRRRRAAWRTR